MVHYEILRAIVTDSSVDCSKFKELAHVVHPENVPNQLTEGRSGDRIAPG
jgi:hypothetical protein